MAYVKPGVEITQVQKTVSPNLITPNLNAVIIGPGYYIGDFDALYPQYTGSQLAITVLSGLTSDMSLDNSTVYVDLVGRGGKLAGTIKHLTPTTDFTVTTSGVTILTSINGSYVQDPVLGTIVTQAYDSTNYAIPKIGFRALRGDLKKLITVETATDIESNIGEINTANPLGFGLYNALLNSNSQVYGYGVENDGASTMYISESNETTAHSNALSYLSTREVYALAPLTATSGPLDAYKDHVNTCSAAINKHERIVFDNYKIPWSNSSDVAVGTYYLVGASAADAAGTARVLKQKALALQERRVFWTFPDVTYVQETRHISTVSWTFINRYFGFSGTSNSDKLFAKLDEQVTLSTVHPTNPGKVYAPGTEITGTVLAALSAVTEKSEYRMLVPVPGYYINAIAAGQVSGQPPQQGFTNLPTTGLYGLKFANDWFTEAQLNNIAEGGNYIMVQPTTASPIVCRHQLSTDMTSVERRELNITKTIDFVAKFCRNGINGYIGRYNITPAFLSLLVTTLNAQGLYLKRAGYVNDFKVLKVEQDPIQKDVILVDLSVLPQYPVNYIKINLIF
jgi:hypothetical protein